jgi:hypothetical protein
LKRVPCRITWSVTHRRLRLADVLAYRDRMDTQAAEALDAVAAEAEELGLYEQ